MKIAHTADIQIRFGSRHEEYKEVFERFYEDLRKEKPDRIYIGGDLVHHKINMSPGSFNLLAEFLIELSKIAPTDVILGNHDVNLQQLEQGDALSPIFKLVDMIQSDGELNEKGKRAFVVTKENANEIDYNQKSIYYYKDSGFYDLKNGLVYGVYACVDNEILKLENKEEGKKYIAFYHGTVYGSRGDNGYAMQGDNLMRLSTFDGFDMVMLGDIHEYQTFRDDETVAYSGSLIQQNFGESINKGYLLWDTEDNSHERKFILNDYGFAKIDISRGEDIEERLEYIDFSNNKNKTKVYIVWEDYEENYSIERENQIKRYVRDNYGCESVRVEFSEIKRDIAELESEEDGEDYSFEKLFNDWLDEQSIDLDNDLRKELLDFALDVDKTLEIDDNSFKAVDEWELESMEVSNILSFDVKPITINFNNLRGLTGIFGKNFNGKSNVIKAIVWGLYEEIISANRGGSKYLINRYTESNDGYVKLVLLINGEKYRILRKITTKNEKNSFGIKYEKLVKEYDEDGVFISERWSKEVSDKKTLEKTEVKNIILDAIGTFDDFTKTSLQAQGGASDYINQGQQPKNNLIKRFLGLDPYKDREDYGKKFFNDVKRNQKNLGKAIDVENEIKDIDILVSQKNDELNSFNEEKSLVNQKVNDVNESLLELNKELQKVEPTKYSDIQTVNNTIESLNKKVSELEVENNSLEKWLSNNFKKELPFKEGEDINSLKRQLEEDERSLNKYISGLDRIKTWVNNNPKLDVEDKTPIESENQDIKVNLINLRNKLPTYQGKSCPTCGNIEKHADPKKEEECLHDIKINEELLSHNENKIKIINESTSHNQKWDMENQRIPIAEESIKTKQGSIQLTKDRIKLIEDSKDIINHNLEVESKTSSLNSNKKIIENNKIQVIQLTEELSKIESNKLKKDNNSKIESEIFELNSELKAHKLVVYNIDQNINKVYADIKVLEKDKVQKTEKLSEINNSERLFKKYSIYMQAVHRDGIPASIIRKKLPIINGKINSILQDVVDFKIEMSIQSNGDINEFYYFSEDKTDMLPLYTASGSQKFISSIVITEALRYMSRLTKPSLRAIDEGFGTLDDELTIGVTNILSYLKNKYKNVLVITHRNEIKDFMDNVIEVSKVKTGLSEETLEKHPEAGVSKISIS